MPYGTCFYCREGHFPQCSEIKERLPGGFAEYIVVPEVLVEKGTYLLPSSVSYDRSTFIEPLACVVRSRRLAGPGPEKTVTIPVNDFWTKEVQILTSYYCGPPDIQEAIELLAAGAIDVERMITHRLPLKDIVRGFELVMSGEEAVKVIIEPHAKEGNSGS